MSDEEKVQALVAELRVLESYYNEVNARESMLTRVIVESRAALEAVKGLIQTGLSEILVPIGGGIFIHAQSPSPESLVVSIGANIAVEKTRDGAIAFLEERLQEVERAISNLEAQKVELAGRINSKRMELNSLVEKLRPG